MRRCQIEDWYNYIRLKHDGQVLLLAIMLIFGALIKQEAALSRFGQCRHLYEYESIARRLSATETCLVHYESADRFILP